MSKIDASISFRDMANQKSSKLETVEAVNSELKRASDKKVRAELKSRFGIPNENALGVPMAKIKSIAKSASTNHKLAKELWNSGGYESRIAAVHIADPDKMTSREMDRWVKQFDSWAICDTACMHLFDQSPLAWKKVPVWIASEREFTRRAGFAMIWALSVHDKEASDKVFRVALKLIEKGPEDDRPLVKKAANMALRSVGKRNRKLNEAAIKTATKLAQKKDKHRSWIGRHALRELTSTKVQERLSKK